MEENNNKEINSSNKIVNDNSYWKNSIGILIAAFLGGFLAMYFVADQVFAKQIQPNYYSMDKLEKQMFKDFKKMYEQEKRMFEHDLDMFDMDLFNKSNKKFTGKWFDNSNYDNILNSFVLPDVSINNVKIDTKLDDNKYKVIISLAPFKGDESKINYNVSGRKLTVFGNSNVQEKNFEQDISFSHDFILPQNANIANISKKKNGNNLIIEVPLID